MYTKFSLTSRNTIEKMYLLTYCALMSAFFRFHVTFILAYKEYELFATNNE